MAKNKKVKDNRGRKPIPNAEKVVQVNFYTKRSVIDNLGGMERARNLAKIHLENRGQ